MISNFGLFIKKVNFSMTYAHLLNTLSSGWLLPVSLKNMEKALL